MEYKGLNVLSTFNGMGCIWLALDRAGIKVNKRYSSEIDKYANIVNDANYPDTIQLGDVTKVKASELEKIDLFVGGSPCQGFSFAGKQLNFEDERGKLFFEFVRLWGEVKDRNPNAFFLLENVVMKKEYQDVISEYLGVEPILINSALVSAQNRKRLYWTNIPDVKQPEDKGILLKDILEDSVDLKFQHTDKAVEYMNRKVSGSRTHWDFKHHSDSKNDKSSCLTQNMHKGVPYNVLVDYIVEFSKTTNRVYKKNYLQYDIHGKGNNSQDQRAYYMQGKHGTLATNAASSSKVLLFEGEVRSKSKCVRSSGRGSYDRHEWDSVDTAHVRKLTPIECERLQTVPDNYTNHVSNTQRYKMLGNGWTVDVIAHIINGIDLM